MTVETFAGQDTDQSKAQPSRNIILGSCLFPHHLQFGFKHQLAGLSHFSFYYYQQKELLDVEPIDERIKPL